MIIDIEGFHGTGKAIAETILETEFKLSAGDKEWLGDGVYFFIEGLDSDPAFQAQKWAMVNAWDNILKQNKYDEFAVISALIQVEEENFLDLTTAEGLKVWNYLISKFEEKLLEKRNAKRLDYMDGLVINFIRNEKLAQIDVAKGSFYIKLDKKQRINHMNMRTNNATICAVYETGNIVKGRLYIIETGKIDMV